MDENLYQDQIIKWSKKAENTVSLESFHCCSTVNNPLCGDKVTAQLQLDGETIKAVAFQIRGCMLCKASTSILSEIASGMTFEQINKIGDELKLALKSSSENPECFPDDYKIFDPVRSRRSRHSCVLLPFDAVFKAISEYVALAIPVHMDR